MVQVASKFYFFHVFNYYVRDFIIKSLYMRLVTIQGQKLMDITIYLEYVTFERALEWLCNEGIRILILDD